jgi:uncharacterized membrane protein YoaK (UPF0700 family)
VTASDPEPSTGVLGTLTVLTAVSGIVDAVSYLGLGHVFTANMTGNIVLLGFAVAGAPGFSVTASLTSIGSFLLGAILAGRLGLHLHARRHRLVGAMVIEGAWTGVAAAVSAGASGSIGSGPARFAVIAILAAAMGVRNSTIRRLAVPDVTTTVLTMTLTGLAADSSLAGGHNPKFGRRASAVVAMLVGAFVGALLFLHLGPTWPLALVSVGVLVTAAIFVLSGASRELDGRSSTG